MHLGNRNRFNVLGRLFGRTDDAVIATLYSHCLGRPLLVEPQRGEQLLGAYMRGAVDSGTDPEPAAVGSVAVMEISGALVSRPMPGPSGPGPQNYEQLSAAFEAVVDRSDVDAIVLRLDTPGGFADGLFDFTDQIKAARREKPIHAVVEHMAYSAGYAIAAAADQVWVTRTAGVGSVGVAMYHVDQSEANRKDGLKLTPIFAGDRKIDFSPHFPLSEQALALAQTEVDEHYRLFVDAVAKYRGMSTAAVRNTQSRVYMGPAGIDVGFADRVGTVQDALDFLTDEAPTRRPSDAAPRHAEPSPRRRRLQDEASSNLIDNVTSLYESAARTGKGWPTRWKKMLLRSLPPATDPAAFRSQLRHAGDSGALGLLSACQVAGSKFGSSFDQIRNQAGSSELEFVQRIEDLVAQRITHYIDDEAFRTGLVDAVADNGDRVHLDTTIPTGQPQGRLGSGQWDKTIEKFGGTVR